MHRLFVALRPPESIRDRLIDTMQGVPDARWQDDDQLHLTLRFIGEVDGAQAEDVALALTGLRAEPVTARIAGVGRFGFGEAATTLWAGVAPKAPLAALHAKVDRALVQAGLEPERRAYVPHVTLARLSRTAESDPTVARWLAVHADLASADYALDELTLYESMLGRGGCVNWTRTYRRRCGRPNCPTGRSCSRPARHGRRTPRRRHRAGRSRR